MARKSPVSLGTLNTILNTAPLIIQGATKLIKMLKDRGEPEPDNQDIPETIEGLKNELYRVNSRLDANYDFDIQQIKLIEELAKQNEMLATSLKKTNKLVNIITIVALLSLLLGIVLFLKLLSS